MIVVFVGVLWATVHMYGVVPKGFIPESDNDTLNIGVNAAQGTSFYDMITYMERIAAVVNQNPNVDAMMVNTGGDGGGGQNRGDINIQLTPRAKRTQSASQIAQSLRGPLGRYPGFRAFVNVPQSLQIGGFQGNSNYNLMVESLNYDELTKWAPVLEAAVSQLPELQEVSTNLEVSRPGVNLVIDRDKSASVGLTASNIANALGTGLGPRWSTTIYGPRNQYRVLLELAPQYQGARGCLAPHRLQDPERQSGAARIGFVVDDAIVMLENIVRHMEAGEAPLEASLKGSKEIGFTILTMTTSLAAVFIPILFMGGILGRLFREFAVTITTAILISGVVSVTLTPMLCSRFLKVVHTKKGFAGLMDRAFDRWRNGYEWSLGVVLRHRLVMLGVFAAVLVATVQMFGIVPKGFIPDTDNDTLNIKLLAAQGTSFYEMVGYAKRVATLVNAEPERGRDDGEHGRRPMNTARFNIQLTPRATRQQSAMQIAQQFRGPLGRFPGFRAFVNVPPAIQIGGQANNSNFALIVQSLNNDELYTWAPRLEAAITELPEVQDVSDNMQLKSPRVDLVINRDKAAAVGLNATQIENVLSEGFGQKWTSTIYGARTQYQVLIELDPQYQERADSLKKISFRTAAGTLVPLESVVDFKDDVGPQTVTHYGQLPAVTISFSLRPGVSLGSAVDHVNQVARQVLPPTVTTSFQGSAKVFQASLTNLGLLLFIAIGVVYIVLGMLYESYIHPLTILSGLPSAGLGALVTLWLFGNELNIYSFVGLIMLIGIVKKNAIMQIDFALEAERQHGKTPARSTRAASSASARS